MAWRNIMSSVFSKVLDHVVEACIRGEDEKACKEALLAAADTLYTPLKPVDTGLGVARMIASRLAAIAANAVLQLARSESKEATIRAAYELLKESRDDDVNDLVKKLLNEAGASIYEPAVSREARESLFSDLKAYFEPEQPQLVLRRRRIPKRSADPLQSLRRLLRELGRQDPILARQLSMELKRRGVSV
ncbi:hypothetical protein [Hyperthermus butylicus]|uniref:Uncharacterized protein n=1 Tax=Hyperthermus butylicus (strain DSM 5456 / JCM 9403 / PLM1-5) TaxID=415426 RepID=A2BJY1_HYPBU|nr:hypothetical protein [Hyperthermus butylicus]ABM80292.1 hypothetical protein Hbut_0426 [Hyperthermus butylicus DSM 5456]